MSPLVFLAAWILLGTVGIAGVGAESDRVRMQRLLDWAMSRGAVVDNVRPARNNITEDGRALYTSQAVERGKILVYVPSELIITDFVARRSPLMEKYASWFLGRKGIEGSIYVSLFLFLENTVPGQRQASDFAAYYAMLPPFDFDFNIPMLFWPNNQHHPIAQKAWDILITPKTLNIMPLRLAQRFNFVMSLLRAKGGLLETLSRDTGIRLRRLEEIFRWSTSIVMTRSWVSPHPSIKGTCALVPIIDMLDHKEAASGLVSVTIVPDHSTVQGVGIQAHENMRESAKVFDSYDPSEKCSAQEGGCEVKKDPMCAEAMLFTYGFLPDEKEVPARSYCVDLGLLPHLAQALNIDTGLQPLDNANTANFTNMSNEMAQIHVQGISLQQRRLQALNSLLTEKEARAFRTQDDSYVLRLRDGNPAKQPVPPRLMAVLRISKADENVLSIASERADGFMRSVSAANEKSVLHELRALFSTVLSEIPSSEEADLKAVKTWQYHAHKMERIVFVGDAAQIQGTNVRNYRRMSHALIVRIRRRRILESALRWVDKEFAAL